MKKQQITLIAVGDIALGKRFEETFSASKDVSIFDSVNNVFKNGDVIFGNLECPISNNGTPIFKVAPKLRANPSVAHSLKKAGFTILNLANNHINDYGNIAITETIHTLETLNIEYVGVGNNINEANLPKILNVEGFGIGFLGFCDKEESIATKKTQGAAEIKEDVINEQIDRLKDKADYIVLSLHMGIEFVDFPSPHNIAMCRRFIDRGVNVVLGHHPHVPQGYEFYNGGLIIYSLGNFIFDMGKQTPDKARIGYIYQIVLSNGNVVKVIPVPYKMDKNFIPLLVEEEDERDELLIYLKRLSNPINDQHKVEAIWYSISRFFTRQLIKGLLYRTFKQGKWWFPMWWLKIVFRPQVRRVWTSYILFLLKGTYKGTSKYIAFANLNISKRTQ